PIFFVELSVVFFNLSTSFVTEDILDFIFAMLAMNLASTCFTNDMNIPLYYSMYLISCFSMISSSSKSHSYFRLSFSCSVRSEGHTAKHIALSYPICSVHH